VKVPQEAVSSYRACSFALLISFSSYYVEPWSEYMAWSV